MTVAKQYPTFHTIQGRLLKMFEENEGVSKPERSFDPLRDPDSFTFKSKVRDLGTPTSPFNEPKVAVVEEATFAMG